MNLYDTASTSGATDEQSTGAIAHVPHHAHRRDLINGRRQSMQQRHTDSLPLVNGDTPSGKLALRQVIQLREENRRLHWEYNALQAQADQEIEAIHSSHQQEIEQYQRHLLDMMEERRQMQETHLQLEERYQDLYHSFQTAAEEEAHKIVTEAAQTVELTPEHTPLLLQNVRKTLELQAKQTEDQHVAQALYLMREAQRKTQQMEQELDQERQNLKAERQNLANLQNGIRAQAKLRYDTQQAHLQAKWSVALGRTVTLLFLCLPVLQLIFYAIRFPLLVAFLLPIFICLVVAGLSASVWSSIKHFHESVPHKKKGS